MSEVRGYKGKRVWEVRNEADDLEQRATDKDIENLKIFARQQGAWIGGDLRPEVLEILRQTYPVGSRLKIQSLDIPDYMLRSRIIGQEINVMQINDDGAITCQADAPIWGEHREFQISFGKATYKVVKE